MFEDRIKKLDVWDIALVKLYLVFVTLAAITYIPALMTWVHNTNRLYFLLAAIIFVIRPLYRVWIKK